MSQFVMAASTSPLRVSAVAIDPRALTRLALFFEGPCRNRCVLAEEHAADLSLVDLDTFNAAQSWKAHRERYPERPAILLSLDPAKAEGELFVQKPIKATEFLSALQAVQTRLVKAVSLAQALPGSGPPGRTGGTGASSTLAFGARLQLVANPDQAPSAVSEEPSPRLPRGKPRYAVAANAGRAASSLQQRARNTVLGAAADIDPSDREQLAKAYYDPTEYLQGHVRKAYDLALEKGLPVTLAGAWRPIAVDPERRIVATDMSDAQLRGVCYTPVKRNDVSLMLGRAEKGLARTSSSAEESADPLAMEIFLWKIALWCSRGRVPTGTGLTQPVQLLRWPFLTRLLVPANALPIAALWTKRPCSLLGTAEALAIPQRDVFTFYSGVLAIGLVQPTGSQIEPHIEPEPIRRPGARGLFKRLLARLHRG